MGDIAERSAREDLRVDAGRRKQLQAEQAQWQRATGIVERFLKISENPS